MTPQAVIEVLEREPFEPFRICLSSGESYEVRNPHMVAVMKSRLFVALPESDRSAFVSYLHIASLESISNGHAKRKRKRR